MQRFFRLLIWDAIYCVVPAVGYAAQSALSGSGADYLIAVIVYAVCGGFLSQLARWGTSRLELLIVALPGLYLALAPFLAPLLSQLPLPFNPVPAVLLLGSTQLLRQCGAIAAGFTLWRHIDIRMP